MSSSSLDDPVHRKEIEALIQDLTINKPDDVIQYCANYFHTRLQQERSSNRVSSPPHSPRAANTAEPSISTMADTAPPSSAAAAATGGNPFDKARNPNMIQEEDEERDTFGSPTQAQTRSPFSGFGGFGGGSSSGGGGGGGGGLFGSWGGSGTDDADAAQHTPTNFPGAGRRVSVSAEAMQPDADSGTWRPPQHAKTDDQLSRLRTAVSANFLFASLDDDSFATVLGALSEKSIPAPNIRVIDQGAEGDYFYVIESGEFDVYIHSAGAPAGSDLGTKVASVKSGGSFGELALMYNAPRAATVVSSSKGMLWQLDRMTFRKILMTNASERRKMYEGFLEEVPLLEQLKPYERAKIADALETVKVASGQNIITEGEPGEYFYMLELGEASAFKQGIDHAVKEYKRGDYFGELALLNDRPRAASVVAKTDCKVARLGRDGFKRLLGPVENMMKKQDYEGTESMDPLAHSSTAT